jgi:hypothetical protein
MTIERQVITSQAHCNAIAGRYYAAANNVYPELRINFHGDYLGVLDPALPEFWQITVAAEDTARGIVLFNRRLILRQVTAYMRPGDGYLNVTAVFEPEAPSLVGEPGRCMDTVPDGGGVEVVVDQPGAIVTGSSVHYLGSGTDAWALKTNDEVLDLGADPYWRIKLGSTSPSRGVLFYCGEGHITRVSSITPWIVVDVTPENGPPGGPDASELTYMQYAGNPVHMDEHIFAATNSASGLRSWLLITEDNGQTWAWQETL